MLTTVVGSYPAPPQEPSSLSSRISSILGSYDPYHAAVELALCALASRFSALASELINGSLDDCLIGEERPGELSYLVGKMVERLAKPRELLSLSSRLYAHIYISIQI